MVLMDQHSRHGDAGQPCRKQPSPPSTRAVAHRQGDLSELWTVFPGLTVRAAEDGTLLLRSPLAGAAGALRGEAGAPGGLRAPQKARLEYTVAAPKNERQP